MSLRTTVIRKKSQTNVTEQYVSQLKKIVFLGANDVRTIAVTNIHAHRSAGVTYQKYNPKRTHTASVAGAYPNTDTGYLANNIFVVMDADGLGASVESRADYSTALEFGTSKMAARPFLQPSLEEARPKIRRAAQKMKARGK